MKVTDKIIITNEDNMLLMARYPDNYFDLAIVDPPYGLERLQKGSLRLGGVKGNYKEKLEWDKNQQKNILTSYLEFQKIKLYGVQIIL
jgi:site-specific DNA-methyltransferase (adenine-specific)